MKWRKRGRLYTPPGAADWMATHGQVPFAWPLDDRSVRVFFTTKDDRHRSHIAVAILDLKYMALTAIQADPVMEPGRRGTFDDDGAMMGSLVVTDDGVRCYYQGYNPGGTVSTRTAIGLATLLQHGDRLTLQRCFDGPVLDRNPLEPIGVGAPFVRHEEGAWRMWYRSDHGWDEDGEPCYGIRHARSFDGIAWQPDADFCLPPDPQGDRMLARASVLRDGDMYRMWFSARRLKQPYRIGYAESKDGTTWSRRDEIGGLAVSDAGWDCEMVCYPHVFDAGGRRLMLYCGNSYGRSGFGIAELEQA